MAGEQRARRWVLHLDMDAFFASVEQLTRPTLRGRPVLVGGAGPRGVVAGASYEARVFGARSAMPMSQARRLVGASAVVLPPRMAVYSVLSGEIFELLRSRLGVLEQLSFDEAFAEPAVLVGESAETVAGFCEQVRSWVRERTGLIASVGAGSGKQLAKIASGLAKPDGVRVIGPDEQQDLLAALPVRKLWGIGPVAQEKLRRVGIETVGAFAALPAGEVAGLLGSALGPALHQLARGIDERPVAERGAAKQISAETTFPEDLTTAAAVADAVRDIATHTHKRLAADGRWARTVTVKVRRSDMSVHSRSSTLSQPSTDVAVLTAAALRLAPDPREFGAIRLLGVSLSGLVDEPADVLFPELDVPAGTAPDQPVAEGQAPRKQAPDQPVPDAHAPDAHAPDTSFGPGVQGTRWHAGRAFYPGADVAHPEFGHGWVQGCGHDVVTVRFETRSSGPGIARTFHVPGGDPANIDNDAQLTWADPVNSLK